MRDSDPVRGMCDHMYVCGRGGGGFPWVRDSGFPGEERGVPVGSGFGISWGEGVPVGSGFGISDFPIILEKSLNLLIFDVYTVKKCEKNEKVFFEL